MSQNEENGDQISNAALYTIMILMMLFGSANTLVMKAQDDFKTEGINNFGKQRHYIHPYFQCFNMFLGEFCCLGVYFLKRLYLRRKLHNTVEAQLHGPQDDDQKFIPSSPGAKIAHDVQLKTKINPIWFAIPAACDLTGTSLMNIGLTQTAASVYQMLRGAVVVVTALFSVVFLKRKQHVHHLLSLCVIIGGVTLVGWASTHYSKEDPDSDGGSTTAFGIMFVLLSQCFVATQFVVEEKLFDGYYLDPLFAVGCEGFFGCCYTGILLPIFQHIPCTLDGVCGEEGVVEDTRLAFQELHNHYQLMLMFIGVIISIACFNTTGQAITKYASAAQRSTVDTCRTLFIWIIQLGRGVETFNVPQLIAFIALVFGTLVYNEIVVIPIGFMKDNTKKQIEQREKGRLDGGAGGPNHDSRASDYMATSPGATYNHGRNLRAIDKKMGDRDALVQKHQQNMMLGSDDNDIVATSDDAGSVAKGRKY